MPEEKYSSVTAQAIDASKSIINSSNFIIVALVLTLGAILFFGYKMSGVVAESLGKISMSMVELKIELAKQTVLLERLDRLEQNKN